MSDYVYLVIEGRPDQGLRFFGPFVTEDEAVRALRGKGSYNRKAIK